MPRGQIPVRVRPLGGGRVCLLAGREPERAKVLDIITAFSEEGEGDEPVSQFLGPGLH